jgi:serine/threonine protein kinase
MAHPHVVKLLDVFEIDSNAMATVQELCCTGTSSSSSGSGYQAQDLDQHLKAHGALPEKEAKSILTQLLRYLVMHTMYMLTCSTVCITLHIGRMLQLYCQLWLVMLCCAVKAGHTSIACDLHRTHVQAAAVHILPVLQ